MKKLIASLVLVAFTLPLAAAVHPSKGEKYAAGGGLAIGLAFNKKVRKSVGKAGAAAGKHVYRFVTFRK